jgi:predicted PolB exonuclease-like 3'-5' exonuclease
MNLFFDIETIPSGVIPELDDIKAPANYKVEATIQAWRKENQIEVYKKQALNSMQGRIICIGYSFEGNFYISKGDEHSILLELAANICGNYDPYQWIGWNISSFDIPWLWRKAIQHNIPALRNIIPHGNSVMMTDLMRVWAADYKDYVSLSDCAKFLGIEHDGGNGSEIYDLWQSGNIDAIAEHCKRDIETTMEIYERITQ